MVIHAADSGMMAAAAETRRRERGEEHLKPCVDSGRRGRRQGRLVVAVCVALLAALSARAVELSGSLLLSTGTSDVDGSSSDHLDEQANLLLRQVLTDYLTLQVGYRFFDFRSDTAGGEVGRRSREPRLELLYARPELSASLSYQDRTSTDLATSDRLDIESLIGWLSWRPTRSTTLTARYRDESNLLDTAVFGRGTDSRLLDLIADYRRQRWSASYTFESWDVTNVESGLELDQQRHELRLDAARPFLGDRLWLGFAGWASRIDQDRSGGTSLGEPVAAREGLGAVDPSPEIGELAAVPALVDGDLRTPVEPRLEIGGAATFRNAGVDLGFTLPVSQLEVTVDAASDAALPWRVYHSRDNLLWEEIPGVGSTWDGTLLHYSLRFPETEDRYFKAVNVGTNAATEVAVTEVRALREAGVGTLLDGRATLYRADATARFQPHSRVSGDVSLGINQDQALAGAVARRDYEDVHAQARLTIDLPADLQFDSSYRYVDSENRVAPVLLRTEDVFTNTLWWRPLETLEASLSHIQRDERDEQALIRATRTDRLAVSSELLPGLDLLSTVEQSDVEDPFFGSDRRVFAWREVLDAEVSPTLTVGGGYSFLRYETRGGDLLLERTEVDLRTTWRATPYLTLSGDWGLNDDSTVRSLRQSYGLTYSPGTKLTLSAFYQDFSDDVLRDTRTGSATVNYRLNPRFRLFGSYTRTESRLSATELSRIRSFRAGVALVF